MNYQTFLFLLTSVLSKVNASECDDIVNAAFTNMAKSDSNNATLAAPFPAQCLEAVPKVGEGVQYKSTLADVTRYAFCSTQIDGFNAATISYSDDLDLNYDSFVISSNITETIVPLLYDTNGNNGCQSHLIMQPVGEDTFEIMVQTDDTTSDVCIVPFEETEMAGAIESVIGRVIENHKTSFCVTLDSETSPFRVTIRGKYSLSNAFASVIDIGCYSINSLNYQVVDDCTR